jgi:hypothetical protein
MQQPNNQILPFHSLLQYLLPSPGNKKIKENTAVIALLKSSNTTVYLLQGQRVS